MTFTESFIHFSVFCCTYAVQRMGCDSLPCRSRTLSTVMLSVVPSSCRAVSPTIDRLMTTLRSEATGVAVSTVSSGAFFSGGVRAIRLAVSAGSNMAAAFGAMFSSAITFVVTPFSLPVFSKG